MKNFVNHNQVLIDHAIGRVQHLNRGSCPDLVRGHDSRDSDCPVCIALDAAITSHTGAALNDLCEAECAFANKPAVLAVQPTPLTDEEISEHGASSSYYDDVPSLVKVPFAGLVKFVRRIEEAHGISAPVVPTLIPGTQS